MESKPYTGINSPNGLTPEETAFLLRRAPIHALPEGNAEGIRRVFAGSHIYLEKGTGRPLILLHGLFGGIHNYASVMHHFSRHYRVIMPYLPMYDLPAEEASVTALGHYLHRFIQEVLQGREVVLAGTSTGAGTALVYATLPQHSARGIILCGSIGLTSTPIRHDVPLRRKSYESIRYHAGAIFHNPGIAPVAMIDEIFSAIQNNEIMPQVLNLIRSATQQKMTDTIQRLSVPTLLLWGANDCITPIDVAWQFQQLIPHATLQIIPECGHAVSHEKPDDFIREVSEFLQYLNF